jgi:hypothetical protein
MKYLKEFAKSTNRTEEQVRMMCADRSLISDNCENLDQVYEMDDLKAAHILKMEFCSQKSS